MIPFETSIILGAIAALFLTIVLYIKIIPAKCNGTFSGNGLQFLHDFFNFKKLYIEKVLRFFYVLSTVACFFVGAFLLIGYSQRSYYRGEESTAVSGLILMLAGPIILRLVYEILMMLVLLVKNVIEINNKLQCQQKVVTQDPTSDRKAADEAILAAGGWRCTCGRVNASYISTCACFKNRKEIDQ